ncbi:hypothetical protein [Lachnoclostridium sp. MSJ-17]|uniref:hypothetical protein n=1 Tax=Lachnoclostridium sp. MSJ-17 TaxID=2841516 RepID=UPI001C128BAC|nr:hypothetical protein [Lachnoclostridium sp. MSJ-17]MBU5462770.1 hypothetical protein [Lachnoclostridium sp. MSJ-17]
MTVAEFINMIINKQNITKASLSDKLSIKPNNLQNKLNRDNFTSLELSEIADVLNMNLVFKDKESGEEYLIDYPADKKFQPKRNNKKKY